MNRTLSVRRADHLDTHSVTRTIADAFHPLAVTTWLAADPVERARVLYANFGIHVDHALTHGQVWTIGQRAGVAVWHVRDRLPPPPSVEDYDHRLRLACGPYTPRFRTLDAAFDAHHPGAPHHYLMFLAVAPERQGEGIGSVLLEHHHWELDRAGIPAYLEATSVRSRALYLRHGYRDHGTPIELPDGPRLWPMWRAPRRPGRPPGTG